MTCRLEVSRDSYGSFLLGWLAPGVLYARFEQTLSAQLGARFARRFCALVGEVRPVHYFADSSELISYDLLAIAAILDAVLSKKEQFKLIVARPWNGALGPRAKTFAAAVQCMEYVTSAAEFEARLQAASSEGFAELPRFTPSIHRSASAETYPLTAQTDVESSRCEPACAAGIQGAPDNVSKLGSPPKLTLARRR